MPSSSQKMPKALFIRLDRIGDLAVTMSVDQCVPDARVQWLIPKGLAFMAEAAEPPRSFWTLDAAAPSWLELFRLWRSIRRLRPEVAVVFHAPWWASFLIWAARVPARAGPLSQWHAFVFLNRGVRQRRSQSTEHEFEYNARLVEAAFGLAPRSAPRLPLRLEARLSTAARDSLLARHRLPLRRYFVVHPGMGGSALNWPTPRWIELIRKLSHVAPVAITGTSADEAHLAPLRAQLEGDAAVRWLDGRLTTLELLALLAGARALVAPSTGVLHLGAALGLKSIGLYSPVPVQAPKRWGPLGPNAEALFPRVHCPAHRACLGSACPRWNCMERIKVEDALAAVLDRPMAVQD